MRSRTSPWAAAGGRAQYQYTLSDADLDELNAWTPRMLDALKALPQLKDANSDQQSSANAVMLTIDRQASARFGITPADIDAAIYNQIGQRQIARPSPAQFLPRGAGGADGSSDHAGPVQRGVLDLAVHRQGGAPVGVRQDRPDQAGQPADQPPGPVPRGHHLLQPGAGRIPRRGHQARRAGQGNPSAPRSP
ncbi:MAG: efflux RND transporter permease subunit [Caulobacteraceae bacterium]